ncbi:MAG TPA: EAL domain-containing protein [Usitatibacteraceae bacterium]|nr:EAL domain-containing protein [Usitatibacteraceae bacterium]
MDPRDGQELDGAVRPLTREDLARHEGDAAPCWVRDLDNARIIWANAAALQLYDARSGEELYRRDFSPLTAAAATRLSIYHRRVCAGRRVRSQWTLLPHGRPVTVLADLLPYRDDAGRILLFFRARVIDEAMCKETLRMLDGTRHSSLPFALYAEDGQLLECNAAHARTFGQAGEHEDESLVRLFADRRDHEAILQSLGEFETVSRRARTNTVAGPRWHLIQVTRIPDAVDGAWVLHTEFSDVTEQVEGEIRAHGAEKLLQRLANELDFPVAFISAESRFQFVNDRFCEWTGKPREAIIGQTVIDAVGKQSDDFWRQLWQECAGGTRARHEVKVPFAAAGERWVSVEGVPVMHEDGRTDGLFVIAYDIQTLKQTQRSLATVEKERLQIADNLPLAVCKVGRDDALSFANAQFCNWFGLGREATIGRRLDSIFSAELLAETRGERERAFAGETVWFRREATINERRCWVDVTLAPATDARGHVTAVVAVLADVTDRVIARQKLGRARETLSAHLANTPLGVIQLDRERRVVEWTGRAAEIFSWTTEQARGRHVDELKLFDEESRAHFEMELDWLGTSTTERFTLNARSARRDGSVIHAEWNGSVLRDDQGRVDSYLMLVQDQSARVAAEHHLQYIANHDLLTGLANRAQFVERLKSDTGRAARHGLPLAVALLDLDRLKVVNDSLGHPAGDQLLQQVGERIASTLVDGDLVARSGGDEFLMLLDLERLSGRLEDALGELRRVMSAPFNVAGQEVFVTASIGISRYPQDATDPNELIKHAEWAMFRAKDSGRNSVHVFSAHDDEGTARLTLEADLKRAVDTGQFELHYQPKFNLAQDSVIGAEALLRWRHPQRGLVPPDEFIPIAEDTGLILDIGAWVFRETCRQLALWRLETGCTIQVAVNLSPVQLRHSGVAEQVLQELRRHGLPGSAIMVEITESSLIADPGLASRTLEALRDYGVHAAIDDFGKGFSSLIQLKRLPIDALKIDGAFIRDLVVSRDDAAIVNAIIGLAHNLELKVVAECVETAEQLSILRRNGCDEVQGYYLGRPLPADEFLARFHPKDRQPAH